MGCSNPIPGTFLICPECAAVWKGEETCQGFFYEMFYWEAENPDLGEVHHLMVLCYHLQHPSLYSMEGLEAAKQLLVDFVKDKITPSKVRKQIRAKLDSHNRKWNIKAPSDSQGSYRNSIQWTIITKDVVEGGASNYCENVRNWARVTLEALKASGNL